LDEGTAEGNEGNDLELKPHNGVVVYQYNTSRGGVMRFISLDRVERALR
jgi:hypothetical protein